MQHTNVTWRWHGPLSNFYYFCKSSLPIDSNGNGAVLVNQFYQLSPKSIVERIEQITKGNLKTIYLAINRYEILPVNDLLLSYPESIADSLDLIVSKCSTPFKRLYSPLEVSGHNFVASHGLDIYVYECD